MDNSILRAQELARIGREHDLAEVEYEDAEVKIRLQFEAPPAPGVSEFDPTLLARFAMPTEPLPAAATPGSGSVGTAAPPRGDTINSPLAGVFYRAPRPDADPFVKEQDSVGPGQTLCIVEAMKLMNEITAERACKITKILVENAEAVEEGQPLFVIE
ncbi:MAG: acetyl-CoA carboxylase biotin carboxyl carrier protein [Vulcanimicrobiota bacterium]